MRARTFISWFGAALAAAWLAGCAHGSDQAPGGAEPLMPVAAERSICGWEELGADAAPILVAQEGPTEPVAPGQTVIVLSGDDAATYGAVKRAIAPTAATLVRLKVVVSRRWLLPATHKRPVHPHPPDRASAWVSHVGNRRITRSARVPAQRFADLRVSGDRVTVYVENEAPGGVEVGVAGLAALLQRADPPVSVFALTAADETPWRHVVTALVAAACYDRGPGREPHEVILD